jgi:hypothetical protein
MQALASRTIMEAAPSPRRKLDSTDMLIATRRSAGTRSHRLAVGRAIAIIVMAAGVGLSASVPIDAVATPVYKGARQPLRLLFNEASPVGGFTNLVNSGSAHLRVRVKAAFGGTLVRGRARTGGSNGAVRTPRHDASETAPRAVVEVTDRDGRDSLNPSTDAFTFGADVRLDRTSEDDSAGSYDNGDNLVQRGLFDADSQYKIQLDHDRATCRIQGSDGAVAVTSRVQIKPRTWYRVRCSRSGQTVSIAITSWDRDGGRSTVSNTARGATGSLRPDARSVPLSVGGKLTPEGAIVASTDQLNGRIDNVIVRIG